MKKEYLRYDLIIENALRNVVREALSQAAKEGLLGNHHFYISFHTNAPGVVIPDSLRAKYPKDMTIVLQYQYYDLQVEGDSFGVTLSFSSVPSRLTIPFSAITAFADPSVNFALQFQPAEEDEEEESLTEESTEEEKKRTEKASEDSPKKMGEVISLDTFRKKT